jgi:hypothetical protein
MIYKWTIMYCNISLNRNLTALSKKPLSVIIKMTERGFFIQ